MTKSSQEAPPATSIMSRFSTTATIPGRLILDGVCWGHIHASEAHHREFPEIRAEGESPATAIQNLAHKLTRVLDTAITQYDRATLERALEDARAFNAVFGAGGEGRDLSV
jgi:hypothetical protein